MGEKQCVLCQKVGRFTLSYNVKTQRAIFAKTANRKGRITVLTELLPETLPPDGPVCDECSVSIFTKIDDPGREEREKKQEEEEARVEEYKLYWDKHGIVQFKNERMAILKREIGSQVQFIIAFDDLTREGYRCVAQDEGREIIVADVGTGGVSSYYYFQKIECVSCSMNLPSPVQ